MSWGDWLHGPTVGGYCVLGCCCMAHNHWSTNRQMRRAREAPQVLGSAPIRSVPIVVLRFTAECCWHDKRWPP